MTYMKHVDEGVRGSTDVEAATPWWDRGNIPWVDHVRATEGEQGATPARRRGQARRVRGDLPRDPRRRSTLLMWMCALWWPISCAEDQALVETYLGLAPECVAISFWPADETALELALVESLNTTRAEAAGCDGGSLPAQRALVMDPELRCAARRSARDMAGRGRLSLIDSDGNDPSQRAALAGAPHLVLGELQARDLDAVDATIQAWLSAPETCALLRDVDARYVGVGTWSASSADPLYWAVSIARP